MQTIQRLLLTRRAPARLMSSVQKELAEISLDPPCNCSAGPKGASSFAPRHETPTDSPTLTLTRTLPPPPATQRARAPRRREHLRVGLDHHGPVQLALRGRRLFPRHQLHPGPAPTPRGPPAPRSPLLAPCSCCRRSARTLPRSTRPAPPPPPAACRARPPMRTHYAHDRLEEASERALGTGPIGWGRAGAAHAYNPFNDPTRCRITHSSRPGSPSAQRSTTVRPRPAARARAAARAMHGRGRAAGQRPAHRAACAAPQATSAPRARSASTSSRTTGVPRSPSPRCRRPGPKTVTTNPGPGTRGRSAAVGAAGAGTFPLRG
jgi:hypothetical protein